MKCINPATGAVEWEGSAAGEAEVDRAVMSAQSASEEWADTPIERRIEAIQSVAERYFQNKAALADAICRQTGKPRWEAGAEVDSMIAKAAVSIAALRQRRADTSQVVGGVTACTRFAPIGVVAVLGPFNMPGHLPNGHLMPAVLAGNAVIFKPSEMTCLVGELMGRIWTSAGLPPNVFNFVQGAAATGMALARHPAIDGVLFTGSAAVGLAIHQSLADRPDKLLALEMGGNNPLIVWDCADLDAAAYCIVQSAFITSGQRCSCSRRLIIPTGPAGNDILTRLMLWMERIRVGLYSDDPEPFMGTVISAKAAQTLLQAQANLLKQGAISLVPMGLDPRSPALLTPGLMDVSAIARADVELFGPLLQVIRAADFPAAIREANATRYGLSAGLLSDKPELYEQFRRRIRAGVVNWNRPLTGARSDLPFGGVGSSGNHRPSAQFAADYCSDSVASLEAPCLELPSQVGIGFTEV